MRPDRLVSPSLVPPPTPTPGPDQVVVTVLLVSLSLVAAFLLPNIDQLFGLLGGTTARPKCPGFEAAHAAHTTAPEARPPRSRRAPPRPWTGALAAETKAAVALPCPHQGCRSDCLCARRHHRGGHLLRRTRALLGDLRRLHVPLAPPSEALLPGARPPLLRPKPKPKPDPDPDPKDLDPHPDRARPGARPRPGPSSARKHSASARR